MTIEFDEDVFWDGDNLLFWATKGRDRIRCEVSRKAVDELVAQNPQFSQNITDRNKQIAAHVRLYLAKKIEAGQVVVDGPITKVIFYIVDMGRM